MATKAVLCALMIMTSFGGSVGWIAPTTIWRAASSHWGCKNRMIVQMIDITHTACPSSFLNNDKSWNRNVVVLSMADQGYMADSYNDDDYEDDTWFLDDQDLFYDSDYDDDYEEEEEYLDEFDSNKNNWTWETFQKHTHVLLPPSMPTKYGNHTTANTTPLRILHFVGGTLFGSYPLQFYKPILESVAKRTNSIVVASSIPIVLNDNPLNHYKISRRILNRFWNAYRYVIVDEYGHEAVRTMKIVGLSHSLGARLMMLMSDKSHVHTSTPEPSKRRNKKRTNIDYNACIFMSFNNYNALESIPGLAQLGQSIMENSYTQMERNREAIFQKQQEERRQRKFNQKYNKNKQDEYNYIRDKGKYDKLNRRKSRTIRNDANINTNYYTNGNDDIGLNEVMAAVTDGITEGIQEMKTAITPDLEKSDLEFQPTPQELWDRIRSGEYVRNILLVQFDQDKIDQSSKLATIILEREKNIARTDNQEEHDSNKDQTAQNESNASSHCLRFARLKGTHLTPVNYSDSFVIQALKRTGTIDQILEEAIKEDSQYRPKSKSKRKQVINHDLDILSKTIACYIMDKV